MKEEIEHLNLQVVAQGCVNTMIVQPTLEERIKEAQKDDEEVRQIKRKIWKNQAPGFRMNKYGILWYKDQIYVPKKEELRK